MQASLNPKHEAQVRVHRGTHSLHTNTLVKTNNLSLMNMTDHVRGSSTTARMHQARKASIGIRRNWHCGYVSVGDGRSRPQPARLKVCPELLVLQREEFVFPDTDDEENGLNNDVVVDGKTRHVHLRRQRDGSLGIGIKGGIDHNLPVLVSRVNRADDVSNEDSNNNVSKRLFVGDAILKVNGVSVTRLTHAATLRLLQNSKGDVVRLSVKHCRSAAPFLLKSLRSLIPESHDDDPESEELHQVVDGLTSRRCSSSDLSTSALPSSWSSTWHGRRQPDSPSCASMTSSCDSTLSLASSHVWLGLPRVKRRWRDAVQVPLSMALVTRYIFGTDKLRPNGAFEVRGNDNSMSGVIQHEDVAVLNHWIRLISDFVQALSAVRVLQLNRLAVRSSAITFITWIAEGVMSGNQPWQTWATRVLVLKDDRVVLLDKPPDDAWAKSGSQSEEWESNLDSCMFRLVRETELVDERQHCFLLRSLHGHARYFSMETKADLLRLESAWHRALCLAITRIRYRSFDVVYEGRPASLILDWEDGFLLQSLRSPNFVFVYTFGQLRESTDDGDSTLRLVFVDDDELVERVFVCPMLQPLLFAMHAFLTAKVAALDPAFTRAPKIGQTL